MITLIGFAEKMFLPWASSKADLLLGANVNMQSLTFWAFSLFQ